MPSAPRLRRGVTVVETSFAKGRVNYRPSESRARASVRFGSFTFDDQSFSSLTVELHQLNDGRWRIYTADLFGEKPAARGSYGRYYSGYAPRIYADDSDPSRRAARKKILAEVTAATERWWASFGAELEAKRLRDRLQALEQRQQHAEMLLGQLRQEETKLREQLSALTGDADREGPSALDELLSSSGFGL